MSRRFNQDFLIEVQKGNVAGHSMVHKFGRNDAVPNGSWAIVSLGALPAAFRSSAATMRVKAGGNAADTAAGAGATEVTIQGIDSGFAETAEAVATAGASASSATTASFWRVHRAWVSGVGTYGAANTGIVTIEDSAGAADMMQIGADEGQSQHTCWTVPTGKKAYLLSVHVSVDSKKIVNVRVFTRKSIDDTSAPMPSKRLKLFWDGLAGVFNYRPAGPEVTLDGKEDLWVEAWGDGAAAEVSVDFELLVVDD